MISTNTKHNPQTITISLGAEGIKLAHAYWKLVCLEHGVSNMMTLSPNFPKPPSSHFQSILSSSRFKPRSLLVDIDDRIIAQISASPWKNIHTQIPFPRDAPPRDSFPKCYDAAKSHSDVINQFLSREVDYCDNLTRFIIFHSITEASGAALFCFFCKFLKERYPNIQILTFSLLSDAFPGPTPYNSAISLHFLSKFSKFTVLIPKEPSSLSNLKPGVIQSFICSTFTSADRFNSSLGVSVETLIARENPKMTQFCFPILKVLTSRKNIPSKSLTIIRSKDSSVNAHKQFCLKITPGLTPQLFHLSYGVQFTFDQVLPELQKIKTYYKKIKLNNAFLQTFSDSPQHFQLLEDSYKTLAEFIARLKKIKEPTTSGSGVTENTNTPEKEIKNRNRTSKSSPSPSPGSSSGHTNTNNTTKYNRQSSSGSTSSSPTRTITNTVHPNPKETTTING